jgi:hypothetical protein
MYSGRERREIFHLDAGYASSIRSNLDFAVGVSLFVH